MSLFACAMIARMLIPVCFESISIDAAQTPSDNWQFRQMTPNTTAVIIPCSATIWSTAGVNPFMWAKIVLLIKIMCRKPRRLAPWRNAPSSFQSKLLFLPLAECRLSSHLLAVFLFCLKHKLPSVKSSYKNRVMRIQSIGVTLEFVFTSQGYLRVWQYRHRPYHHRTINLHPKREVLVRNTSVPNFLSIVY